MLPPRLCCFIIFSLVLSWVCLSFDSRDVAMSFDCKYFEYASTSWSWSISMTLGMMTYGLMIISCWYWDPLELRSWSSFSSWWPTLLLRFIWKLFFVFRSLCKSLRCDIASLCVYVNINIKYWNKKLQQFLSNCSSEPFTICLNHFYSLLNDNINLIFLDKKKNKISFIID